MKELERKKTIEARPCRIIPFIIVYSYLLIFSFFRVVIFSSIIIDSIISFKIGQYILITLDLIGYEDFTVVYARNRVKVSGYKG